MSLGKKQKFLIFGFVAVLLVAIPLTVYLLQQQQSLQQQAAAATNLSFEPPSTQTAPIETSVGEQVDLNLMVDPSTNLVSIVRVEINYDPGKLEPIQTGAFTHNPAVFPGFLQGPIYDKTAGKIAGVLSIDTPTKAIQTKISIGTISFKAKAATGTTPTKVDYTTQTQVFSAGSGDQHGENVLAGHTPAFIAIAGDEGTPTPEPTLTDEPIPTSDPNATPTPGEPNTGSPNENPICESLNTDRETTGTSPYSIAFTAVGSDTDGNITKVTFNFGDGPVQNVTEAGGIGTSSVSAQISHTYESVGTYVASAVMTDDRGGTSASGSCSQTITVNAGPTTPPGTGGNQPLTTPAPDQMQTGPGDILLGIGAVVGALAVLGGLLFFVL